MLGANAGAMAEKAMPKLQRVNQAKEAVMGKAGMPSPNYGMGQEMQGFHQQPKAMPMAELTNPGNLGEPLRAESLLADDYQIGPKPTMTPEEKKGLIAALITLLSGTAAGASAGRYASRQKPVQIQAQNQAVPAPRAKVRLPDEDLRGKGVEEP